MDKEAWTQLGCVIASKRSKFETQTFHGKRLRAWDHYLVSAAFKGEEEKVKVKKGKKAWAGGS